MHFSSHGNDGSAMTTLNGSPVSPGYAEGQAFIFGRWSERKVPCYSIARNGIDGEQERLHQAIAESEAELAELQGRIVSELGQAEADIFAAHLALLKDRTFREKVQRHIAENLVNVEHALQQEMADLAATLEEVENEYFRERAKDIRDVGQRVLRNLGHGPVEMLAGMPPNTVLVASELLPSDTLSLDRRSITALVTERGGATGHAAILARSLGIPSVSGLRGATRTIAPGQWVLVDGSAGTVTVAPTPQQQRHFAVVRAEYEHKAALATQDQAKGAVTADGLRVSLMANIAGPAEVPTVGDAFDGVGLFRTDYQFLKGERAPDEQQQFDAYAQVLAELAGRPVVIRTVDLGGDKRPRYMRAKLAGKAGLAMRGLRLALGHKDLFATQLRALARSAAHGHLRVMYPMVLGGGDLRQAMDFTREVFEQVGAEMPSIGAMVETPSALFELPTLASQVDFLSIGTNDLVQYMLAADRNSAGLLGDDSALHPSVLRAIRQVVDVAGQQDKPVSVCGEVAAVPEIACLLVGLGLRILSVTPARGPAVSQAVRSASKADLEPLAEECLAATDPEDVIGLLGEYKRQVFADPDGSASRRSS